MSLVHPKNPAMWEDGTARSMNTGFTRGFTDEPINWIKLQHRANNSKVATRNLASGIIKPITYSTSKERRGQISIEPKGSVRASADKRERLKRGAAI